MKAKVAAGEQPWLAGWEALITDPLAQHTFKGSPRANMNLRQVMSRDAHAAYLNAIRWYVSGDTRYADCAIGIFNDYSSTLNQIPSGGTTDIVGLGGIGIAELAMAAEIMRISDRWLPEDFERFKSMMEDYLYPVCHDFLTNHNGACISHYWTNWDANNIGALIAIGVLCDNQEIFDEGVDYYLTGAGNGSLANAVPIRHSDGLAQWQESGRDQEHAQLGVGLLATVCEIAWKQGVDLYSLDNNRLLAGAEYVARTNLMKPVPFGFYDNCDDVNHMYVSTNGIGRLDDRPVWEMIYNHYAVRQGLSTPNVKEMVELTRPEFGSKDHLGHGTLTFTLDAAASPLNPFVAPAMPVGVSAEAGIARVSISWDAPTGDPASGYRIHRSTTSGGPYEIVGSRNANTYRGFTDRDVENGQTYYYVVSVVNQAGESPVSAEVSATPLGEGALPGGWAQADVGSVSGPGSGAYSPVSGGTFVARGQGSDIGGTADNIGYVFGKASGDLLIEGRMIARGASKVGIMIRESLEPGAKAASVALGDLGWRVTKFGARTETDGEMAFVNGNRYTWVPVWYRLERSGNVFTASQSSDGVEWHTIGSRIIEMSDSYLAGFLVSSGSVAFDHLRIEGGGLPPAAPVGLAASGTGSTQIDLSWEASAEATSYVIKRSASAAGPFETVASGVAGTSYVDTGLEWETTYHYTVSAGNLGGVSGDSSVASATTLAPDVPLTPEAINAVAGDGRITVSWEEAADATTYELKRSTTAGGPYSVVASLADTHYTDLGTANGTTYYYVVSASNYVGASPDSEEASATPASGALGYWPFNESGGDIAADVWNGADGVLAAGASFGPGVIGNGLQLDGSGGSYVTLPENLVSSLTDFTISAWVRPDATSNWMRVFDFGTGQDNYMFLSPRSGRSGNGVRYAIRTPSVSERAIDGPALEQGKWTHLAVTQSGTTGILYVNGIEVGRNTGMNLNPSNLGDTNQNWIGKSQWPDPLLKGAVDDFRIYSRALGSGEVSGMVESVRPAAPTDLMASGEPGNVSLSWTPSPDAESYVVKRATSSGGSYQVLATGIEGNSYVDTSAEFGPYFYVVAAVARSVESQPSNAAEILLPPSTPSQPIVGTANGQVDLLWEGSVGAAGYDILRSSTSGGPYETVASIAGNYYSDSGLVNGETYYYAVVATNAAGSSAPSEETTASPTNEYVPISIDVGTPGVPGSVSQEDGVFTIQGSGSDIWGNWDRFRYVFQAAKGDVTVTARVLSLAETHVSAKAGVMIRSSLDGNSQHVSTLASPVDGRASQQWRSQPGGGTSGAAVNDQLFPKWLRVARKGNTFTSYHSADGFVWRQLGGSVTVSMGENVFVGMAVSSHDNGVLTTAKIDNFSITGPLPDAPSGVTASTDAGITTVSWSEVEGASSYTVLRATSPSGPFEIVGEGVVGASFQTEAGIGEETYYYTVIASDGSVVGFSGNPDLEARGAKLEGSAIGTSGSWGNNPATRKEAALDGDLGTFFDGPQGVSWVGIDLGEGNEAAVTKIRYAPRSGYAGRMLGGAFQGSNDPSFAEATTLFTVTTEPAVGILASRSIASAEAFRYLRYVSLAGGSGNVAEIEFYGVPANAPVITSPESAEGMFGEPFAYQVTATNYAYAFEASGLPAGLSIDPLTGEIAGTLEEAGSFSVLLSASNDFGIAESILSLTIAKAPATVVLDDLSQYYDGTPRIPSVTTSPSGLAVDLLYDGSATPPVFPGAYAVEATIDDPNYEGATSGDLVVRSTALTRHAPTINADLDGSIQVLLGESFALNSGAMIASDLLLPGTPTLQLNGDPDFVDTLDGPGEAEPTDYYVTLNSGSVLRYLVRRVDPIGMPTVEAPPAPAGARDVSLNKAGQEVGDFATLRNLTLNSKAGTVAVPPGDYGWFTANGGSTLVLGVADSSEPTEYNLQGLALNNGARIELVGPVVITLVNGSMINGSVNPDGEPDWLTLRIAAGDFGINSLNVFHGHIVAPNGQVTLNDCSVMGSVVSDRLTLNGSALLLEPTP